MLGGYFGFGRNGLYLGRRRLLRGDGFGGHGRRGNHGGVGDGRLLRDGGGCRGNRSAVSTVGCGASMHFIILLLLGNAKQLPEQVN